VQSIATTGHDIDGSLRPFLYCSFTRNPPIYGIAAYGSSLIFGKNPFGLRFPAALFGLVAILLIYGIAFELTRRRDIATIAAALQATLPIFVHFSRVAWEPASELPFLLGGLYVLVRTLRNDDRNTGDAAPLSFGGLTLAAVLLALTCYTYMAGWFYAAALGGTAIALNARRFRSHGALLKLGGAIAVAAVIAGPALSMWFGDGHTIERTQRIATFAHGVTLDALGTFFSNYLAHFRWSYLVTTGDPIPGSTWRYMVGFGAFYWWVVPLAALGLLCVFAFTRGRWAALWTCAWLVLYPFGGALTNEGVPNAPRTLAGAPVFCILAAIGCIALFEVVRFFTATRFRAVTTIACVALFVANLGLSVTLFSRYYFTEYVHQHSNAWDSGTGALFAYIRARAGDYDRVCFAIRPAYYAVDSYARFYIGDLPIQTVASIVPPQCYQPGTLLATDEEHPTKRAHFVFQGNILDVDGGTFAAISAYPRRSSGG
jgi:4-amino-4-deoxy-L-arabinose transferase-like glycosyltransferase